MGKKPEQTENRRMTVLLEMARALGTTCDLDTLLGMVVCYSMELLQAERATIFLYDPVRRELYSRVAEGTGELRFSIDKGLAGAVARTLQVINIPDAYNDERFNPEIDKKTGYRTQNLLTCPMIDYEGKLVGVLQVLNKKDDAFDQQDVQLAQAFSAQAGVALQRAHLLQEYLEKKQLENALQIAREIQQGLFPQRPPQIEGFDLACWNRPCDAIGGDYCDFMTFSPQRLLLTMGDVTGHGIGPALISCATRAMIRAMASVNEDIRDVMQKVNTLIQHDLPGHRFVTAFTGLLDARKGILYYCSAGQGPMLWLHENTGQIDILAAGGIPMGILEELGDCPVQKCKMKTGDIFALLTDGYYEWARQDKELFGTERVKKVLLENKNKKAEQILAALQNAVEAFADTKQADDLTGIIIKRR